MAATERTTLKDQVAIITGASSGMGAAVARDLSRAGMKLVITGRREQRLRALAAELAGVESIAGDIVDPKLPQQLLEHALRAFGRCDVVFNNAAVMEAGSVDTIDVDRVCSMVRANVEAAFRMAYVAVRHFKAAGRGHLVNTSSVLGTKVRPGTGAYAGTKFALEALSEDLRMELAGTGVKVSCVEPGLTLTEFHRDFKVHPKDSLGIARPLAPEDVARCVRFILEQPAHVLVPRLMLLPAEHGI